MRKSAFFELMGIGVFAILFYIVAFIAVNLLWIIPVFFIVNIVWLEAVVWAWPILWFVIDIIVLGAMFAFAALVSK